jgi:hypothetical protein
MHVHGVNVEASRCTATSPPAHTAAMAPHRGEARTGEPLLTRATWRFGLSLSLSTISLLVYLNPSSYNLPFYILPKVSITK